MPANTHADIFLGISNQVVGSTFLEKINEKIQKDFELNIFVLKKPFNKRARKITISNGKFNCKIVRKNTRRRSILSRDYRIVFHF